jgi:anti-sigma factor RsiW
MKCKSIHIKLIRYLDGEIKGDLQHEIEAHLKTCSHCSELLVRLKKALDIIDEEKKIQYDPYMLTRIMARLEDQKEIVIRNRLQVAFQAIAFTVLIAAGIYSGIILGKDFSNRNAISGDYQNEVYFLDELQHENMVSVFLSDESK